jgi:hypothetical protein
MRRFLTGYAVSFNRRHRRWGHLFQNRYKSILCQEENYLLELTRYIHLNPLRAKLVENMRELDTYKYCGHGVVMGRRKNDWQDTHYVLRRVGTKQSDARREYRRFVVKGIGLGKRADLTGGGLIRSTGGWTALKALRKAKIYIKGDERILGDSDFVKRSLEQANEILERKYRVHTQGLDFKKIAQRVSDVLGLPIDQVLSSGKNRETVKARGLLCYWAARECGMSQVALAQNYKLSSTAVSNSVKRGKKLSTEKNLKLIP